jgi:putative transposase
MCHSHTRTRPHPSGPLLTYIITSNHVHLVVYADETDQVTRMMQAAAGTLARDYNRRKDRSGAFWEDRYHATLVDSGKYLWACLKYVELNMVRCGVVRHPREWTWSGYSELMGERKRNRFLDLEKLLYLLRVSCLEDLRLSLNAALEEAIAKNLIKREPAWTESLAIGSMEYVASVEARIRNRQRMDRQEGDGYWILREEQSPIYGAKNEAIGPPGA